MKRPFLFIAAAFGLGILSRQLLDIPVFYIAGLSLAAFLLCALFSGSRRLFIFPAFAAFLFLGALDYGTFLLLPKNHIKNIVNFREDLLLNSFIQGTITNRPHKSLTSFKQEKTEFTLDVEAVGSGRDWQKSRGVLLAEVFNPGVDFQCGQRVILEGALKRPRPATNPGQFDYRKFLERKKIFYILKVKEGNFCKIINDGGKDVIKKFAYKVSARLERLINEYSPPLEASILNAILLGRRQEIDNEINDDFIHTGTVHILSISGLHVGLLAFIILLVFRVFRIPFKVSAAITACLIVFYSIMVDNKPPVVRSAIMILVFLLGRVLKREQDGLNSLSFSAALILFFNPQDLFDIGFQLSFLTMAAIIYMPPRISCEIKKLKNGKTEKQKNYILSVAAVSFCAWLWSAPFIARYFNIVSPVTIIANIVVVPLMFFTLASSVAFIGLGGISATLALILSGVANLSILVLVKTVSVFSRLPFAYFRVKSPSWIFIAVFYVFMILFLERRCLKLKAKYFLITLLVFLNITIWRGVFCGRTDTLEITFLDVGKGDAIFVEFPGHGTMLIDAGTADMGRLVVSRFLASKGINGIDLVAATHPHADHTGGLAAILKNFKVRYFLDNGVVKENDAIKGFRGVDMLVLNPPPEKFQDANNNSIVIKLTHGKFSALFCGDIRQEALERLLSRHGDELASAVLKVPHHGSSLGGLTDEFLEKTRPAAAVISTQDGYIDKGLLAALNAKGISVYRTDTDGAVILKNKKDKYLLLKFLAL